MTVFGIAESSFGLFRLNRRCVIIWCGQCSNNVVHTSKAQMEIYDYIKTLCPDAELNNRTAIAPLELDIYVPSANFGFEFNGLRWHSEEFLTDRKAHFKKAMACRSANIKLLAVYSDEWETKPELIKAMVRWRLNKFNGTTLRASKLTLKRLDKNKDFSSFFLRNHLDGHSNARYAYGLFHNDKLVQCLSIRTNHQGEHEICRLATDYDYQVHGGAAKLIKRALQDIPKDGTLITFSNNRLSTGNTYSLLGGTLLSENSPSYWYTDGKSRYWRFKCKRLNSLDILAKYPNVPHTERDQAKHGVFSMEVLGLGDNRPLYSISDYGHKKWSLSP